MKSKVIKKVVAGLIFYEGKLFAAARNEKDERFGKYEFPGGKVETGETGQEALKREIFEELAMDIKVKSFCMHVSHEYSTFQLEMDVYFADATSDNFVLNVHQSAGFYTKEQILKLPFLGADLKIIDYIKEHVDF
ncbi:MAG: (deoxy)nucleoside triphosphate pyrophosphohydrolase [Bacilli bacterium]|jgi:8-oxo-dGTP diphosphatase